VNSNDWLTAMTILVAIIVPWVMLWLGYKLGQRRLRERLGNGLWMGRTVAQIGVTLKPGESQDIAIRRDKNGRLEVATSGGWIVKDV
jgi:hypothetical protein